MPLGKYSGQSISTLTDSYVDWVVKSVSRGDVLLLCEALVDHRRMEKIGSLVR